MKERSLSWGSAAKPPQQQLLRQKLFQTFYSPSSGSSSSLAHRAWAFHWCHSPHPPSTSQALSCSNKSNPCPLQLTRHCTLPCCGTSGASVLLTRCMPKPHPPACELAAASAPAAGAAALLNHRLLLKTHSAFLTPTAHFLPSLPLA